MINVYMCSEGNEYFLKMQGHAEYTPGNDVVCAGASAIAYSLLGYLRNAGKHLVSVEEERVESGGVLVRCTGDGMVAAAYKMALIGLLQLEAKYPANVCVTADFDKT